MRTFILTLALLLVAMPVFGASVTATFDAPVLNADGTTLADLAGYKIHYGAVAGVYTTTVDIGLATSAQIDCGDVENVTHYFNVTAYDTKGNESAYNGEQSFVFGANPPMSPTNLIITP